MTCLLRARFSSTRKLETFLGRTPLKDVRVFRKGARRFPRSNKNFSLITENSINVSVANFDDSFFDFQGQVRRTIRFLKRHPAEVKRLAGLAKSGSLRLDFAVGIDDQRIATCFAIPKALIELCQKLGLEMELTQYATSREANANHA